MLHGVHAVAIYGPWLPEVCGPALFSKAILSSLDRSFIGGLSYVFLFFNEVFFRRNIKIIIEKRYRKIRVSCILLLSESQKYHIDKCSYLKNLKESKVFNIRFSSFIFRFF